MPLEGWWVERLGRAAGMEGMAPYLTPHTPHPHHPHPTPHIPHHTVPLASDHAFALPPIELAPPIHTSRPSLALNSSGSVRIATAMFVNGAWQAIDDWSGW